MKNSEEERAIAVVERKNLERGNLRRLLNPTAAVRFSVLSSNDISLALYIQVLWKK